MDEPSDEMVAAAERRAIAVGLISPCRTAGSIEQDRRKIREVVHAALLAARAGPRPASQFSASRFSASRLYLHAEGLCEADCPYCEAARAVRPEPGPNGVWVMGHRNLGIAAVEKADGTGWGLRCRASLKRRKARSERRRARKDPECVAGYGRYRGWLT